MATIAGDKSVYNANTDWDNEEKYLSGLAKGGNAWANEQLNALREARAMYTGKGTSNYSTSGYSNMIEEIYKAQLDAATAELKGAYDRNMADIDAAKAKIPAFYQQQRNRAASDAAVTAQNFNEYAAASGLSSGANAQAQLAMNNQLTSGLSSLSQSEAEAMATLETERAKITADYQSAVARAIAEGNAAKAQALYEEAMRVDELIRAEEAAAAKRSTAPKAPTTGYMAMDENGNWQVANPTAEQRTIWNTQAQYGTQYVTAANKVNEMVSLGYNDAAIDKFLATLQASGSLTPAGVAKILGY